VGGLRAVLGQWAGDGLPLPQTKAPATVERHVILFGPEPGNGAPVFVLGGGGGSRKLAVAMLGVHTPPRKIRRQFHEYKHTSLVVLAGESS